MVLTKRLGSIVFTLGVGGLFGAGCGDSGSPDPLAVPDSGVKGESSDAASAYDAGVAPDAAPSHIDAATDSASDLPDASLPVDAGADSAHTMADATSPDDGAVNQVDAALKQDGAVNSSDAGFGLDGSVDGGSPLDAGTALDAAADTASALDAGADAAPPLDAGLDAATLVDSGADATKSVDAGLDAAADAFACVADAASVISSVPACLERACATQITACVEDCSCQESVVTAYQANGNAGILGLLNAKDPTTKAIATCLVANYTCDGG